MAALSDYLPPDQVEVAVGLIDEFEGKFPTRAGGLPPDLVRIVQRERIVVGMMMAASELGYRNANVREVIERARVSRPTFYEHFANKEDCFIAAFDSGSERLRKKVEAAVQGGDGWLGRLRLGLEALIQFVLAEPEAAKVMIVEARGASIESATRRARLLDRVAEGVDTEMRERLPNGSSRSPVIASGVVGGIEALLYSRLQRWEIDSLEELLPSLVFFVVASYAAQEAVAGELTQAAG